MKPTTRRFSTLERLALKWLTREWWRPNGILGPSDYMCRKLVREGLVEKQGDTYRLAEQAIQIAEEIRRL